MSGFLELQLDPLLSQGTSGGLAYNTTVVSNPSRSKETKFGNQSRGYWKLNLRFAGKTAAQMASIQTHFSKVQGKEYNWRFRNYREYFTSIDDYVTRTPVKEPIASYTGGTTMQLVHIRNPGTSTAETVLIKKPDMNSNGGTTGDGSVTLNLYRDGSSSPWVSAGNWTLNVTTGIITFASDQVGHTFSWLGYWDTPSRFDTDDPEIVSEDYDEQSWASIPILEVQI